MHHRIGSLEVDVPFQRNQLQPIRRQQLPVRFDSLTFCQTSPSLIFPEVTSFLTGTSLLSDKRLPRFNCSVPSVVHTQSHSSAHTVLVTASQGSCELVKCFEIPG